MRMLAAATAAEPAAISSAWTSPRSAGERAEDERAERLAAEEDDRVDGEAAAADPGG